MRGSTKSSLGAKDHKTESCVLFCVQGAATLGGGMGGGDQHSLCGGKALSLMLSQILA